VQHDPSDRRICFPKLFCKAFNVVKSFFFLQLAVDNILFQLFLDIYQLLRVELSKVLHSLNNDIVAESFQSGWP
jgi:hypothetical protein